MSASDTPIRRPNSIPFCGRLIAVSTQRRLDPNETLSGQSELSIDFPAMPDTIELARSAEYEVMTNVTLPDGIHMYKRTHQLDIPFSFKLHSFDREYCPNGALTLLQLAARLHSFILPIGNGASVSTRATAGTPTGATDAQLESNAAQTTGTGLTSVASGDVFNPVTCRLEIIFIDSNSPGIACTGYLREVSVKLNGPWLRGPNRSFNLPSSGDFSFTFVHHPGHGNGIANTPAGLNPDPQAYANLVKDQFYNTRGLSQVANYQGLTDVPEQATAQSARVVQGNNLLSG